MTKQGESGEKSWNDNGLPIEKAEQYRKGELLVTTDFAYEKLGMLYLGKEVDIDSGEISNSPFLYKNKSLTTHAVIIGMTGSGKTGLGVGIIEEAMMDNIPSIIIDPKGDMGNLLLTFPNLSSEDFSPWIDPAEAARKEMEPEAYAQKVSQTWRRGLESWGQSSERIGQLKEKTDCTIYTPGSTSGVPISVLNSFEAPGDAILKDTDTLNNMVNSASTSLLSLVGIKGDGMQSKEHILLSSILLHFWRKGENLTLETLIGNVVNPPFEKIGVFSLDTFFKQSERMELAMSLNNVLASPTFSSWTSGEPLDIQRILYTEAGKARTAIFSIAHLSETERMFFVTMLLNQFVGWMRRQQGASSLKALLYMDEIFGYFPPTANPPSKKPMMLLLKQARAYGVGVVLATQNPVDLDYKGLSNIGTWFVGRLQTSQDQEKVLEGIVGASDGNLDRAQVKKLLGDMKGRQFLLNSAHLDGPVLFETRWVMSYLKGPMSLVDISKLMSDKVVQVAAKNEEKSVGDSGDSDLHDNPPILSDNLEQLYVLQPMLADPICLEPWLLASSSVRFYNQKRNIDEVKEVCLRLYLGSDYSRAVWEQAEESDILPEQCDNEPPSSCNYYGLPEEISGLRDFKNVQKKFTNYLYQNEALELFKVASLKLESTPGELMGDFSVRLADHLREKKEEAIDALQEKYATKQERLEKQIETALARVEKEKVDVKSKTTDTILSFGAALLGAFFGRKALSVGNISKATTGMKNIGKIAKEKGEVKRAEQKAVKLEEDLLQLAQEIEDKITALSETFSQENYTIETFAIKPRRSDIFNSRVSLLWEMVAPFQSSRQ